MAQGAPREQNRYTAVGQQRLLDLTARGEVLDDNLYTTPYLSEIERQGKHLLPLLRD